MIAWWRLEPYEVMIDLEVFSGVGRPTICFAFKNTYRQIQKWQKHNGCTACSENRKWHKRKLGRSKVHYEVILLLIIPVYSLFLKFRRMLNNFCIAFSFLPIYLTGVTTLKVWIQRSYSWIFWVIIRWHLNKYSTFFSFGSCKEISPCWSLLGSTDVFRTGNNQG